MDGEDYRDTFSRASADARRQRDFDDLQNEYSGLETGRMKRFLHGSRNPATIEKERKNRESAMLSALDALLLSDPEYARLYHETWDFMLRAEKLAEDILSAAETAMTEMLDNAARLKDGRVVFRDAQGNLRTEEGKLIDAALDEGLAIPDDAPSYEEYRATRERIDKVRAYQVDVLGHARERLEDEDNPLAKSELEEINKDMQAGMDEINRHVESAAPHEASNAQPSASVELPKLGG